MSVRVLLIIIMNQYTNIGSPVQDFGNNVVILGNYRLGTFVFNGVHCLSKLLSELKYLFFTVTLLTEGGTLTHYFP